MGKPADFLSKASLLLKNQQQEIPQPPAQESPVCTMPDASQCPYHKEIPQPAPPATTVAAHRDIHIIPEPGTQGYMPPAPKISYAPCDIWIIEIFWEPESKYPAQPDSHIRVPGKIKINLQGICCCPQPSSPHGHSHTGIKNIVCHLCHIVSNQHLFAQTVNKPQHALGNIINAFLSPHNLLVNQIIAHDRARYQLRKQRNIQAGVKHIFLRLRLAIINIKKIRQQLKSKKGYPYRQGYVYAGHIFIQKHANLLTTKSKVLKYKEHGNQPRASQHQPSLLLLPFLRMTNFQPDKPACTNGQQHQKNK